MSHRRMFASRNPEDALTNAAPIYITVGPQCCGKTTQLKNLHRNLVDVSLDDQPDVYVPVPTVCFTDTSAAKEEHPSLLNQVYHGKSVMERIEGSESTELRLILQRWAGFISPQKFAIEILQIYHERKSVKTGHLLVKVLETFLERQNPPLPENTSVFVLESLFRPNPNTNQTAIQRAHEILRRTPSHVPVAWGNTNSKTRDYQLALEIACQRRRPVVFLVCAPPAVANLPVPPHIPWSPLPVLLLRNLRRLAETGKYVPASAIMDCSKRVEELVALSLDKSGDPFEMERRLVHLSVPQMKDRRPARYRYQLTSHRLIHKQSYNATLSHGQKRDRQTPTPPRRRDTPSKFKKGRPNDYRS